MAASQSRIAFFEHRVEHRSEIAGRRIDDLQHLGGRHLLFQRLVTLGGALVQALLHLIALRGTLGKLLSKIRNDPLGISYGAVWCRAHARTFAKLAWAA